MIFSNQQRSAGIKRKKMTGIYLAFYYMVKFVNLSCGVQLNTLDLSHGILLFVFF